MTTNEKILGTKTAGFGNTVPMMSGNGKYGVWNVLEQNWAQNTPWDTDPDRVIEMFDEMTMARASGKRVKNNGQAKVKVVTRERGGEKAQVVAEVLAQNPGRSMPKLIIFCSARMPEVSAANWRYLLTKQMKDAN